MPSPVIGRVPPEGYGFEAILGAEDIITQYSRIVQVFFIIFEKFLPESIPGALRFGSENWLQKGMLENVC